MTDSYPTSTTERFIDIECPDHLIVWFDAEHCTSCDVREDKSAYWTSQLWVAPGEAVGLSEEDIKARGGIAVPQVKGNSFIIYYKLITERGEKLDNSQAWENIAAFPEDFKMHASETLIKEKSDASFNVHDMPVTYKCLHHGDEMDTAGFPSNPALCSGSLRTQLTFPSCWDGVRSDSEDHSSHVAYPIGSWAGSSCPASHPVRIPTLFYEVIYDTAFMAEYFDKGWKLMYPGVPNQFTNNGEPLFHGDFMNGWDQAFLDKALSECAITPCNLIQKEYSSCTKDTQMTIDPKTEASCTKYPRKLARWKLLFSDEFDGDSLDMSKWSHMQGDGCEFGICQWGNGEFQYYSNSSRYSYVRDGKLVIEPKYETGEHLENLRQYCRGRCTLGNVECVSKCDKIEFSSARLTTIGKFETGPAISSYGLIKIEARIKVSDGEGLWPALWLLPTERKYGEWAASGEIDIFESSNDMSKAHGTIHYGGTWPGNTFYGKSTAFSPNTWHRVTFYWDNISMRWYLNGKWFLSTKSGCGTSNGWYSIPINGAEPSTTAPFDENFHILINMAVGGHFTGNVPYSNAAATLSSATPKSFEVDWIRVYAM